VPANNPFQIHGLARGPFFTDRADEIRRIAAALSTPGTKLLLVGRRRMGKSSALAEAAERARRRHKTVVLEVDLSTVSSLADVGTRLLDAAFAALGRRWKDVTATLLQRLQLGVRLVPDATGTMGASFDVALRDADPVAQQRALERVLDTIAEIGGAKGRRVSIILDEFQRVGHVGGEAAEWHLRGVVQKHDTVSYVFAGSELGVIERMTAERGAFYELLTPLPFGPIDPGHMTAWIRDRMRGVGLAATEEVARRCLALAGDRTRDVVLLAHHTVLEARSGRSKVVTTEQVNRAFAALVDEQDLQWGARWARLTVGMQQVLRAVAAGTSGLTSAAMRRDFGLGPTGTVTNAASALMERELLLRTPDLAVGYRFDNPYFRGWVLARALHDLGRHLPVVTLPPLRDPSAR